MLASQGYPERRAFDDDDTVVSKTTQHMVSDGMDFHTSSDHSNPSGDFVFIGDGDIGCEPHDARARAAALLERMEAGAAGGVFVCDGSDDRWTVGRAFGQGTAFAGFCHKDLHHGDWRGQKVWRVPASTLGSSFGDIVAVVREAAALCSQEPAVLQLQQVRALPHTHKPSTHSHAHAARPRLRGHPRQLQRPQVLREFTVAARRVLLCRLLSLAG
jgi:hypothetical protein